MQKSLFTSKASALAYSDFNASRSFWIGDYQTKEVDYLNEEVDYEDEEVDYLKEITRRRRRLHGNSFNWVVLQILTFKKEERYIIYVVPLVGTHSASPY